MQCRIRFNKKAEKDKRRVLGPCVTNGLLPQRNLQLWTICIRSVYWIIIKITISQAFKKQNKKNRDGPKTLVE